LFRLVGQNRFSSVSTFRFSRHPTASGGPP
jgi:hypothetical protein